MTTDLLREATRCMLAFSGEHGPLLSPMAFWSDGASLWMSTSASSFKVQRFAKESQCAVYVHGPDEDSRGVVIDGSARVFSLDDPIGLATHWPTISAAMAALAVKNSASLAGYALDLPRVPLRWLPTNRVAVRVRMDRLHAVAPPLPGPGIAPALPGVVPPEIRRGLAGKRQVVVATDQSGMLRIRPATWGAGFSLELSAGPDVPAGTPVVVGLDLDVQSRPSQIVGLSLHGTIESQARAGAGDGKPVLRPERATWWHGFDVSGAQIPTRPAGGIVLPE